MSFLLNATIHSFNTPENFSNATFSLYNKTCDVLGFSFSVKIGLILLLSIILLSSLVGNALVIVIVYKHKELRKTTNYFIVNMAVSDFVFPVTVIPQTMSQIISSSIQWSIEGSVGLIFCKMERFLENISYSVSIGSLVCIALDRFVAVVFPLKVHLISPNLRTFIVFATWTFAVIMHSLYLDAFDLAEENGETICTLLKTTSFLYRFSIILFVVGTLIVITLLYCVIAVTLRRQDKTLRGTSVHQEDRRKQQAIKMTLCVIAAFYICNLPLLFTFILNEQQLAVSCTFSKVLWAVTRVMIYLSSTINPIICLAFVKSYRQGFKEIYIMCWKKRLTAQRNMETGEPREITLQNFRRRESQK